MENATKALMIAGAVLIAIMIIGVGMMIFNSGNKTITDSIGRLNQIEVQTHNSQFTGYGGSQKGTTVKELLNNIIASNATNRDVHDEKLVGVLQGADASTASDNDTGVNTDSEVNLISTKVINGQTYEVTFGYTAGLITKIGITGEFKK